MFEADDPRSALSTTTKPVDSSTAAGLAEYVALHDTPKHLEASGIACWYVRGQNFIVNYAASPAGAAIARDHQTDEYVVLVSNPTMGLRITTEEETRDVWGPSLIVVPPGSSSIQALAAGNFTRLFTAAATDLLDRCCNADSYRTRKANVADFEPWPEPHDGHRLRAYSLDVDEQPGRFGRIWRCTTFMVNVLPVQKGPRDPAKLSPHSHDDFEQCSLALSGDFVHHLRWPWTTDRRQWRGDEHILCPSPSVTIIPPPVIHTTEAVGPDDHLLVDIFCPPRYDFSEKAGWVLNATEYPQAGHKE